jgi:hypothetical protein
LSSDAQLLTDPALPQLANDDPRKQPRDRAYVRSRRRAAWLMLVCCHLLPLAAVVALWNSTSGSDLNGRLIIAVLGLLLFSFLGLVLAGLLVAKSPHSFKRWLMGSRGPVPATRDGATGYFRLRIRMLMYPLQSELPHLRFRFRQSQGADVQLRVVNFEQATALEFDLPTPGNDWNQADLDLRWMVRQSDPTFAGDELHLVSDPSGTLELEDYELVPRM